MKRILQHLFVAGTLITTLLINSCSDDPNDPNQNPNPNNPGGAVTITSVTSGDLYWGDELVITGTGFSSVKEENIIKFIDVQPTTFYCNLKYTSENGDIEILSASSTQLKIKVPAKYTINHEPYCGPDAANLEITVKDKKGTFPGMKFKPLPYIGSFAYHYGWFDVPKVTRIGDSVMIDGGLLGYYKTTEYWDDIRLSINDNVVPIKYRSIGLESGWSFYLPAEEYAELNCSEEPDGWGAREMEFKFFLEGSDRFASRMLYVQYLPTMSASCGDCPNMVSKSAGGFPTWKIEGENMYYTEVRFTPLDCGGPSQGMALTGGSDWSDELSFNIPLSILAEDCAYGVHLFNECGGVFLSNIQITE